MIPGINPRQLEQAMKKLGMRQEEIEATEVIIKTPSKNLVVRNPTVLKVNAMGQETLQVTGDITEIEFEKYKEEDVELVSKQANVSSEKAKEALEKTEGDIAKAILLLKKQQ